MLALIAIFVAIFPVAPTSGDRLLFEKIGSGLKVGSVLDSTHPIVVFSIGVLGLCAATATFAQTGSFRYWVNALPRFTFNRWKGLSFSLLIALLLVFYPITFIRIARQPSVAIDVGSVAVLLYALGMWQLVGTLVFVLWPRRMGLPSLALLPLILFLVTPGHREAVPLRTIQAKTPSRTDFPNYFIDWLNSRTFIRNADNKPVPFAAFVVSAEGGGLRAAYWTATALRELDRRTNGEFSKHVVVMTGASGGSLGLATYAAALADRRDGVAVGTRDDAAAPGNAALRYLGCDFLSPMLAQALVPDLIQGFTSKPVEQMDRGGAFEAGLESCWGTDRFRRGFHQLWQTNGAMDKSLAVPALLLNATQVETGKRFIVSNIALDHRDFPDSYFAFDDNSPPGLQEMPLSTAAHLGARFPFVSSPAILMSPMSNDTSRALSTISRQMPPAPVLWGRVVDGGYFDNSATTTAANVVELLHRLLMDARCKAIIGDVPIYIYALIIANDPESVARPSNTAAPPPRPREFDEVKMRDLEIITRYLGYPLPSAVDALVGISARGSGLSAPIEAAFAASDAHANLARLSLVRALNSGGIGNPVEDPYERYKVVEMREELDISSFIQSWEPGLGWYLSGTSRKAMEGLQNVDSYKIWGDDLLAPRGGSWAAARAWP